MEQETREQVRLGKESHTDDGKSFDIICDFCGFTAIVTFPRKWSLMKIELCTRNTLSKFGWYFKNKVMACPECVLTAKKEKPN